MELVIAGIKRHPLKVELEVWLSAKPEEKKPSNLDNIQRIPADHILEKLRQHVPPLLELAPALHEAAHEQEHIWRIALFARFLLNGRAAPNSAYSCLPDAWHMQVRRKKVMICTEMIEDLEAMWEEIRHDLWAPFTVSATFHATEVVGASCDDRSSTAK